MLYSQVADVEKPSLISKTPFFDAYHRCFNIIHADTPELREQAYRLRYQVYCREHGYESPEENRHQMETDAFDSRSIHSLIVDRAGGNAMGCVRLILPDVKMPEASFPIQGICRYPLPILPPRASAAEISRFAISKKMREAANGDCPKDLKCSVALGLMRAIVQRSSERGVTDWFAVMEPSLLRLLRRFSIYFTPVGPLVEHHGMRQPCHANADILLGKVRQENHGLWEFLTESTSFQDSGETVVSIAV